jgi:hypothetical protein
MNPINDPNPHQSLVDTADGKQKCMEVVSLILDGEATDEQIAFFEAKIKCCEKSMGVFNLEKSIKEALQSRICKKEVSPKVLDILREKLHIDIC